MRAKTLATAVLTWTLIGCAHHAAPGASARASRYVITADQLDSTKTDNLYDAITRLHPDWLTSRGPVSVSDPSPTVVNVVMNGTTLGRVDYLRELHVIDVAEVRFWDPGQATARFGTGHPRGVIEVTRRQ